MEERSGRMLADLVPAERIAERAAWAVAVLEPEATSRRVADVLGVGHQLAKGMLHLARLDGRVVWAGPQHQRRWRTRPATHRPR